MIRLNERPRECHSHMTQPINFANSVIYYVRVVIKPSLFVKSALPYYYIPVGRWDYHYGHSVKMVATIISFRALSQGCNMYFVFKN